MSDAIEFLGWFVYFWLYIISKKFRVAWNEEFKQSTPLEKAFKVWEAMVAMLLGLAPVAILIYYVIS